MVLITVLIRIHVSRSRSCKFGLCFQWPLQRILRNLDVTWQRHLIFCPWKQKDAQFHGRYYQNKIIFLFIFCSFHQRFLFCFFTRRTSQLAVPWTPLSSAVFSFKDDFLLVHCTLLYLPKTFLTRLHTRARLTLCFLNTRLSCPYHTDKQVCWSKNPFTWVSFTLDSIDRDKLQFLMTESYIQVSDPRHQPPTSSCLLTFIRTKVTMMAAERLPQHPRIWKKQATPSSCREIRRGEEAMENTHMDSIIPGPQKDSTCVGLNAATKTNWGC